MGGLRQQLCCRRLVVEHTVILNKKSAALLMGAGVDYFFQAQDGIRYFKELVKDNEWIGQEMRPLLAFNREQIETLQGMNERLMRMLERHPRLQARVKALQAIDGVGPVTALTWALETGTPECFGSIKAAMSYCGLTSALRESAGQQKRGPLSKQRNRHLQSVLIEAAKMAPMLNEKLKEVYTKAKEKGGHRNRATLAVARKLVAYLLAADRAFLAKEGERLAA